MPLFWMVYPGEPRVFISDAGGEVGMLKASIAGMTGRPTELHRLDNKTAKKIPQAMIGRALSAKEAGDLLARLS